ncbi:Pleckstrin homology domain-containing protein [Pilaira anomala]|nr:Pleckstrin homology domain-containing protein [Pilaira anomala]
MSRSAFVKNTMSAIHAQLETPAADMDDHRTSSGLSFQSLDWIPLQRTSSNQSAFSTRSSTYAPSSIDSGISRPSPMGSKSWQVEVKSLLKQMYTSLRHCQITNPSNHHINTNTNTNRMSTAFKRSVGTIIWKGTSTRDSVVVEVENSISSVQSTSSSVMQYQSVASHLQHTDIPTCYTSNAPYYKEGMVVRKHLLERTGQKAKYRDWRDCFMVIDRSQARMYKLDTTSTGNSNSAQNNNSNNKRQTIRSTIMSRSNSTFSDSASQMSSTSDYNNHSTVVGGGDWMSHSQFMGSVDLKHTLANALPSGYSRQRQHAFALQQSNGAVFLFQVGSVEQVHEWVSTCNYWAARESKEPLKGGVSSMEYGWGDCLLVEEGVPIINEWEAPTPMMSSSILDEQTQLEVLSRYVQELSIELDQHRDIKPKMEDRFRTLPKLNLKVMSNWEAKSHYLLHEIIKFQNYCDSIEKSLQLQQEIMSPL